MPLYNTTKGSASFNATKLSFAESSDACAKLPLFNKNVTRVSAAPANSLQRKIRSSEFQRLQYAYNKHEACLDYSLQLAESKKDSYQTATMNVRALKTYLTANEKIHLNQQGTSRQFFLNLVSKLEKEIFPLIVNVSNNKGGYRFYYEVNGMNIFDQIRYGATGRKQFIFCDDGHTIYIDTFKDESNNISVITIDSLDDEKGWGSDFAENLFNELQDSHRMSVLNLHTDAQKSESGCKFFSLHFAQKAIKDPVLIAQHILNIENAKHLKKNVCYVLNCKETEHVLNVNYYKHAQSSTRLKLMPAEKRNELLSDGKTLLQHHAAFKIKKVLPEKVIFYSNSIDHFRRKQIEAAVSYYQQQARPAI